MALRLQSCARALSVGSLLAVSLLAHERLYLTSGYSFEVDSFERQGPKIYARMGAGALQIPASEVLRIESIVDTPPLGQASPAKPADPETLITEAARTQGVEAAFLRSVAVVESGLRNTAKSPKGAIGIMQLMPQTASSLHVDPMDAAANVQGGVAYLRQLLLQYKGDSGLALAAYNAGPGCVKKFGGVPPYRETREYVVRVLAEYQKQLTRDRIAEAPVHGNKRNQ